MTRCDMMFDRPGGAGRSPADRRAEDPLPRLMLQLIARIGEPIIVERAVSRPWASALFEGRRHRISLRVPGGGMIRQRSHLQQTLQEAEWSLTGHFVADILIDDMRADQDGEWIELSALTIRDW